MFTLSVYLLTLFLLSYVLLQWYINFAQKTGIVDVPSERSSHKQVKPRGGGLVFMGLWIIVLSIMYFMQILSLQYLMFFVPPLLIIIFIGFVDDIKGLSSSLRICAQFLAVTLALYAVRNYDISFLGLTLSIGYILFAILLVLVLLWSINLFNFMDGTDALAAVEACFIFGATAVLFYLSGHHVFAWLNVSLVSLLLGFLCWNWPNSKLFMGDAGSAALGLLVAQMSLMAGIFHLDLLPWVILYSAFLFDATVTLFRRFYNKEAFLQAHRKHAYQRLQLIGFSHRDIAIALIILNLILCSMAFWAFVFPKADVLIAFLALALLSSVYIWIEKQAPFEFETKEFV